MDKETIIMLFEQNNKVLLQVIEQNNQMMIKKMDERFERMDERFERMDERFDRMDEKIDNLDKKIDEKTDRIIASSNKRFNKIEKDIAALTDEFKIQHGIIGDLSRRVTILEKAVL